MCSVILNLILLFNTAITVTFGKEQFNTKEIESTATRKPIGTIYEQITLLKTYKRPSNAWHRTRCIINQNKEYILPDILILGGTIAGRYNLFAYKEQTENTKLLDVAPWPDTFSWNHQYKFLLVRVDECELVVKKISKNLSKTLSLTKKCVYVTSLTAVPSPVICLSEQDLYEYPGVKDLLSTVFQSVNLEEGFYKRDIPKLREKRIFQWAIRRRID